MYCFEPEIFDWFPDQPCVDWARDVFPALLDGGVPFIVHEINEYWNDVGSLAELRQGTFDALAGELRIELAGREERPGVIVGEGSALGDTEIAAGRVWIGRDVELGKGVRLVGPVVIGDGARIGARASLRDSIVFPCTAISDGALLVGAIAGHDGIVASLRPRG